MKEEHILNEGKYIREAIHNISQEHRWKDVGNKA